MSALLEEAIIFHKKGELIKAENLYKLILKDSKNNFEVTHLIGIIKIQLKQFEEAIGWLNKAILINSNNHSVFNNLGVCYKELKKYPDALNNFKKALKVEPNYAEAHNNLGIVNRLLGSYNEAIKNYYKAIDLKSNYAEAYNNLGVVYLNQKEFDKAKNQFDQAITLRPNYSEAYNNLGNALKGLKQYKQSIECFNVTIKLNKDYYEAYINLSVVFIEDEKYDKAIEILRKLIEIKSDYAEAYNNLGIIYLNQEKFDEAIIALKKSIKIKSDYAEAYNNLGVVYLNQKKFDEAKNKFNQAIKLKPVYAEAYNNLGNINFQQEDFDLALDNTKKAIVLKPDYSEAYSNLGLIYLGLKEIKIAKKSFDIALKLDPNNAKFYSGLGIYYQLIEDYEKTEINLKKALKLSKKKIPFGLALASHYFNLKEFAKAEDIYNFILENEPNDADTLFCRGVLYQAIGRYDLCLKDIEKAFKINPKIKQKQHEMFSFITIMSDICDWKYYEEITNKIINDLKNNLIKDPNTFILMHFCDTNEIIKEATRIKVKPLLNDKEKFNFNLIKNKTIHIGYYSPDFRSHPVGYIMSQILECHNKEIFKITGFSLDPNPDPKSEITSKFIDSFDTFLDCSKKSYIDIVEQSRKLKVDLAIDLTGFTSNNKIKIFANRAAPIQVNFLGYPSTLGVNHDYIVADLELIPKEKENFYFEKIIYMPNTYLPIYTKFNLDTKIKNNFDYKKFNFVFANFNHHGRITPIIFNSWINILQKVENSVLILNQGINKYSEENLLKEAIKKNLDPQRIFFSKRTEFNDHNSKFKNCDLYLDTFPYNAHTTAGTCLLSGVPILTIKGNHFQSRVSSSLLKNLKMDELITSNINEYENKAIYIANSQQEFKRIKGKLHESMASSKIFNAKNYTEDLEKAFVKIYERYHQKLNPKNIYI